MKSYEPLALMFLAAGLALATGCDRARHDTTAPGVTQPGVAQADAEKKPRPDGDDADCGALPSADELKSLLRAAYSDGNVGGLFEGQKEWTALVDRQGRLCALVVSTEDPADAWPGSQAIAKAKAYTANAFSTNDKPLSTARLYTLTQPGHSLWGGAAGNPLDARCLGAPSDDGGRDGEKLCAGTIVFGGGVALYRGGMRVGGLGASGDTSCADHEIAKRMRDKAGLNPAGGALVDDITYSSVDGASVFTHPLCPNTWRNGTKVGEELAASGY
jgi:uncharacterized protein GlcG (DUF336 family)